MVHELFGLFIYSNNIKNTPSYFFCPFQILTKFVFSKREKLGNNTKVFGKNA